MCHSSQWHQFLHAVWVVGSMRLVHGALLNPSRIAIRGGNVGAVFVKPGAQPDSIPLRCATFNELAVRFCPA
jgi:hypothetical protein